MKNQEHNEQAALFQWAGYKARDMPELCFLFAIPNGALRHIAVARKLKAEGVKAGIPDIFLPASRGAYHGLFIEMKTGKNKLTAPQEEWHGVLQRQGYRVEVCYGWEAAKDTLEDYLNG